jgi:hypothetical protein
MRQTSPSDSPAQLVDIVEESRDLRAQPELFNRALLDFIGSQSK